MITQNNKTPLRFTLRLRFALSFTLLIMISAGGIAALSYYNGQRAVNEVAMQRRGEAVIRITSELNNFLSAPTQINLINQNLFSQGIMHPPENPEQVDALLHYFWEQGQLFPGFGTIAFANAKGEFFGANQPEEYIVLAHQELTEGAIRRYQPDAHGYRTDQIILERPEYDARSRNWFQAAVTAGNPTWTSIDVSATAARLDLSAVAPYYQDNQFAGVFLIDVSLQQLSDFLKTISIGKSGKIFITESNGDIVASTAAENPFVYDSTSQTAARLQANQSSDPLIAAAESQLAAYLETMEDTQKTAELQFQYQGKKIFTTAVHYTLDDNLNWLIIVVTPESDFLENIQSNNRFTIWMSVVAIALAILAGLLTAEGLIRPIVALNQSASALAEGRWTAPLISRRQDELGILARSFNVMAEKLSATLTALEERIEKQNQAELALRVEKNFNQAVLDNLPGIFFMYDAAGTFIQGNAFLEEISGYSEQQLREMPLSDLFAGEEKQTVSSQIQQAFDTGHTEVEAMLAPREGNPIHFYLIGWRKQLNNQDYLLGFGIDISQRKQIEAQLKSITRNLLGVVYRVLFPKNGPLKVLFVSEGVRTLLEMDPVAVKVDFNLITRAVQPAYRELFIHAHQNAAKTLTPYDEKIQIKTPSGRVRWLRGVGQPTQLPNGDVVLDGLALDITDQKSVEDALFESEMRFRQMTENLREIFWLLDAQTRQILYVNEAFAAIWGIPINQLYENSRVWENNIHPDDRQQAIESFKSEALEGVWEVEYRVVRPDGAIRWVRDRSFPVMDESGVVYRIAGVADDITERKKAEADLKASEEKFQKAFHSSPVAMIIGSPALGILDVNQTFSEMFGYEREEILFHFTSEVTLWPNTEQRQAITDQLSNGQSVKDFEIEYRCKDGTQKIALVSADVIEIDNEICYLTSAVDITQRKLFEQEIQALNTILEERVRERTTQLEAANKELEAFAFSVSHDLRAPLRGVDGFSRILIEDFSDVLPDQAIHYLSRVRESAQQMNQLINDLLTFSRLTRKALDKTEVNTRNLVAEVVEMLSGEIKDRTVAVTIGDLPHCKGDPALLRQVWMNLLSNAHKYTRGKANAQVDIDSYTTDEGEIVYRIQDNGIGFDMRYADKIFDVFQRLHNASEFEGSGVGLAIAQRIIHRHGGHIWVEAEPDKGAIFYFTL